MVIHTYFYQKYEKATDLNIVNFEKAIFDFIYLIFINDLIFTLIKYFSIPEKSSKIKNIICIVLIPIVQLIINSHSLSNISISGYYTTFLIFKFVWIVSNTVKTIVIYIKSKFVADLIKLIDTIFMINIFLICLTDPLTNDEKNTNQICFYEIYFRYIEFHNLILALNLIYHDRNIDFEVGIKTYTTSAIIGKYDSFRFTVILTLTHYYFILINGLAFSTK